MKTKKAAMLTTTVLLLWSGTVQAEHPGEAMEPSEQRSANAATFTEMFTLGTPSGQVRLGYILLDQDEDGAKSNYDAALGGRLKFETAPLHGIALGAALYTSHSLLQPDDADFNDELSSAQQYYDILGEAYINGGWNGFHVRAGRQLIDTPFADSDDIRMTPHTFAAVVAGYEYNDLSVTGGYLSTWQGVDAGYHIAEHADNAEFGDMVPGSDGTWLLGGRYGSEIIEAGIWYYSVLDVVNVFYADLLVPIIFSDSFGMTLGAQVSFQGDNTSEETHAVLGSQVGGDLYGLMVELSFVGITAGGAYTHASVDEGEVLFGGWGGGPFFTNIDTLVANEFAAGQDADSYTLSLGYDFSGIGAEGLSIGYTLGYYEGGADALNCSVNAEVLEHDMYLEYAISDFWSMDAVYVISDDRENGSATEWDYNRAQVRFNFTF